MTKRERLKYNFILSLLQLKSDKKELQAEIESHTWEISENDEGKSIGKICGLIEDFMLMEKMEQGLINLLIND